MPKVSKDDGKSVDHGPVVDCSGELDGYTVNFVSFRQDIDATPLLKGLPDDRCQCPHWGYVVTGRVRYRCGEREEMFEAGDAFYLPPGHSPIGSDPGSEIIQFSPTDQLREVEAVMTRNMQAMTAH